MTSFHQAMDAGRYAQIYDSSSADLKSSTSRDDFVKLLTAVHNKLGSFKAGATTGWRDNVTTNGHFLVLERSATFERGPGTEEFVFRMNGDRAVLAGWHINSNQLITG